MSGGDPLAAAAAAAAAASSAATPAPVSPVLGIPTVPTVEELTTLLTNNPGGTATTFIDLYQIVKAIAEKVNAHTDVATIQHDIIETQLVTNEQRITALEANPVRAENAQILQDLATAAGSWLSWIMQPAISTPCSRSCTVHYKIHVHQNQTFCGI